MLKYTFHKKFIAFLFLGLLSSVQAFSSEGSEIRSKFAIYEVNIAENLTVSQVCDQQDLAFLKETIKGERKHAVRDIFCFPKQHFFKEANDTTALFIVAFKKLQEYKLDDNLMVTGEPGQIANIIRLFYEPGDLVQFNFKLDGVEDIYYLSPKPAVLVEDIDQLSFVDTDNEYSSEKINALIQGWHEEEKISLVKIVQNTFFDYFPEGTEKRIDGDWGEKTKQAIKKGLADTDFQKNMRPEQVVELLFRDLVKVTENNIDLMMQSSKDSIDDTQVVSSEDNFDIKTHPEGTEKEPVEEDVSEEKLDTNNPPATLQNIDELTQDSNSSENQKSLDAVITEKKFLKNLTSN